MSLRLYSSKGDSMSFSSSFQTKLLPKFNEHIFLFVDFSINESHRDVFKIHVFYSINGFFYAKYASTNLIRHAFGKWDALYFMLAKDKSRPLNPLFIFDFPLDGSHSPYDATFANVDGELHIFSKIYNLSDEHFSLLKKSYKLYKIKNADYILFDFGNCFSSIDKFLDNLKIILEDVDFKLNDSEKLIINPISLNSIRKREDDYNYCMICGKKLEPTLNKNLLDLSQKFPARCETCLKQIYALELYYKLNEGSISNNMLSTSELEYMWDEEGLFEYNFKLLKDYGFLKPFSDEIYKLYLNEDINDTYSSLLKPIEEKEEKSSSISLIDDYFGFNDDKEKPKCKICGEEIEEDDGSDICSNCFDKQMTIEKIHKLVEYVNPGTGFNKSSLIEKGFNHIDLDIIISDLEKNDLLRYDSDDLLILANRNKLNEFIKEYSDSDEYILEAADEVESQLIILKEDLKDESSLDKVINLIDYQYYVECNSNHNEGWNVILKKDGEEFLYQSFYSPFQAKLTAVRYLNEIGVIKIVENDNEAVEDKPESSEIVEDKPKSKKKKKDMSKYAPPKEGRGHKYNKICPVCGREFISYESEKGTLCSSCVSEYSFFEKKALEGIIKGKFDREVLSNILLLRENGNSDIDIAKKLNIEHDFLIKPLIKFLSDDDLLNRISEDISIKASDSDISIAEEDEEIGSDSTTEKIIITEDTIDSEDLIDKTIDFDNYKEHCYISSVGKNKVIFKENGDVSSIRKFVGSYEAKLSMLNHLDKLGVIEIKDDDENSHKKRICQVCQRRFVPEGKRQIYCKDCRNKYNNYEIHVLAGINNGIYTESMALKIKELIDQGYSKSKICSMLKIKNTIYITLMLKFLLDEDVSKVRGSTKSKDEGFDLNEETSSKDNDEGFDLNKKSYSKDKVKTCPICKNTFVPNRKQKYCDDCRSKFSRLELSVLYDIEQGKYTVGTAIDIAKMKQEGKTNQEISDALNLTHPAVITPILNFLLKDADLSDKENISSKFKICPICGKEFIPKSRNGSDLCCSDCRDKYSKNEIIVFAGVKEGKYTEDLADKFMKLKDSGFSNKTIAEKYDVQYTLVNPIINYFKTKSEEEEDETEEKLVKQLFKKDCGNNYSKVILKGIITDKDRLSIFNFISFINCNLNKIFCEKIEEDNYSLLLNIEIENNRLDAALKDLEKLGWHGE